MAIEINKLELGYWDDFDRRWYKTCDSVGGYEVRADFRNMDPSKTIKYAYFIVAAYNRVGDQQTCSVKGIADARLEYTGPLTPNEACTGANWGVVWYNYSIEYMELKCVEIEYMDGSTEIQTTNLDVVERKEEGCYIATAVYGSYDCPEVWTLRRFRDNMLATTWYGRAFIHAYYATSPTLVRMFGHTKWFIRLWKQRLDPMVSRLQANGIESSPYEDRIW